MCALESCEEQCYFDCTTQRIHDYCCWQHAKEHRERIETVWPGSYTTLQKSDLGSHYHSHHQSTTQQQYHHQHGYHLRSQTCENNIK